MRQLWHEQDLIAFFTLSSEERDLLANRSAPMKICFDVLLKTLQYEGKFPTSQKEIPKAVVQFIARQIDVFSEELKKYKWRGRTIEYHRAAIRKRLGFDRWRKQYAGKVIDWLQANIIYKQHGHEQIKLALLKHLHRLKIEPPWNIVIHNEKKLAAA
jgi:hypothetical protein